jgi:hypothetical protein
LLKLCANFDRIETKASITGDLHRQFNSPLQNHLGLPISLQGALSGNRTIKDKILLLCKLSNLVEDKCAAMR